MRNLSKLKEEKKQTDEPLQVKNGDVSIETTEEPVKNFEVKLNKYGFVHIPKRVVPSIPFKIEERLTARIEGDHLTITAATENQPRTEKT